MLMSLLLGPSFCFSSVGVLHFMLPHVLPSGHVSARWHVFVCASHAPATLCWIRLLAVCVCGMLAPCSPRGCSGRCLVAICGQCLLAVCLHSPPAGPSIFTALSFPCHAGFLGLCWPCHSVQPLVLGLAARVLSLPSCPQVVPLRGP